MGWFLACFMWCFCLQVWIRCLLSMSCVVVAHVSACSLLFTHYAAHCVFRKPDMTATSINWQMLNAEVALLLCEKDDKQKTIPLSVTFTQWLIETPKLVSNIFWMLQYFTLLLKFKIIAPSISNSQLASCNHPLNVMHAHLDRLGVQPEALQGIKHTKITQCSSALQQKQVQAIHSHKWIKMWWLNGQ